MLQPLFIKTGVLGKFAWQVVHGVASQFQYLGSGSWGVLQHWIEGERQVSQPGGVL